MFTITKTNTDSESTTSSSSVSDCTSSECYGEHLLQPFQPKVNLLFLKNSKEDSTSCLMFHGTGILSGSHFVHHSKRCCDFIVEKSQLKACFLQYLELTAHLLPRDSAIGSMIEKDFKGMRKVRYIEKLATNIMLLNSLQ